MSSIFSYIKSPNRVNTVLKRVCIAFSALTLCCCGVMPVKAANASIPDVGGWYNFEDGTSFFNSHLNAANYNNNAELIGALLKARSNATLEVDDKNNVITDGQESANDGESIAAAWQDLLLGRFALGDSDAGPFLGGSFTEEHLKELNTILLARDANVEVAFPESIFHPTDCTSDGKVNYSEIYNNTTYHLLNSGLQQSFSLRKAEEDMRKYIDDSLHNLNNPPDVNVDLQNDALADVDQNVFWTLVAFTTYPSSQTAKYDNHTLAYAVVFDSFELTPLLPDDDTLYVEGESSDTTTSSTLIDNQPFAFVNNGRTPISQSVKVSSTEKSAFNFVTSSEVNESYSDTATTTNDLKFSASVEGKLGTISAKSSVDEELKWENIISYSWDKKNARNYTKSGETTKTTELTVTDSNVEPNTSVALNVKTVEDTYSLSFSQPLALQYRVHLVRMYSGGSDKDFGFTGNQVVATYGQAQTSDNGYKLAKSAQLDLKERYLINQNDRDSQDIYYRADGNEYNYFTVGYMAENYGVNPSSTKCTGTVFEQDGNYMRDRFQAPFKKTLWQNAICYGCPLIQNGHSTISFTTSRQSFEKGVPTPLHPLTQVFLDESLFPEVQYMAAGSNAVLSLSALTKAISLYDNTGTSYYGNVAGTWVLETVNDDGTIVPIGDTDSEVGQIITSSRNSYFKVGNECGTILLTFYPKENYYTSVDQQANGKVTYTTPEDLEHWASIEIHVS